MAQAALAALKPIASAFSNQSRSRSNIDRPKIDSILPVLAAVDKKKFTKLKKEANNERIYNFLMQPEVLGLAITLGGMYMSNKIRFAKDNIANAALQSTATTTSVLLGLGYAGVGDLTTAAIAVTAGGASLFGPLLGDVGEVTGDILGTFDPTKWENWIPGYNLYNLLK